MPAISNSNTKNETRVRSCSKKRQTTNEVKSIAIENVEEQGSSQSLMLKNMNFDTQNTSLVPGIQTSQQTHILKATTSGKRSLSASRDKQSPRIAKALRRPSSSPTHYDSNKIHQLKPHSMIRTQIQIKDKNKSRNISLVTLPKLVISSDISSDKKDTFPKKVIKRTTITSMKRNAVVSAARVIRKRKSIE